MATVFGQDSACLTDVGLVDTQITDPKVLIGQRVARRLQTPHGSLALIGDDPDFGWDVHQLINARLSPGTLSQYEQQITAECEKDECVQSATVTITQGAGGAVTITVDLNSAAGPFQLVLGVNQLTTSLVFNF